MDPLMAPTSDAFFKNEKTAAHTESNACKALVREQQLASIGIAPSSPFRKTKKNATSFSDICPSPDQSLMGIYSRYFG